MEVKNFEDLEIWKDARLLTKAIYQMTKDTGIAKDFALRDQIRRASISVMSNIAEGFEREGKQELIQYLSISKGSIGEVRAQLMVALDQDYVTQQQFNAAAVLCDSARKQLAGWMAYLRRTEYRGMKFKEAEARM